MEQKLSLKDGLSNVIGIDPHHFETMWSVLEALRMSRLDELSPEHHRRVPPLVWKIGVTYQCLVRRTVDIADGITLGWNAGNVISAVTMARSLIETAALIFDLTEGIKKAVRVRDLPAVDNLVNKRLLGTRDATLLKQGAGFEAANILSLIDKLDRFDRNLHKAKVGSVGARKRYDILSEYVHPNFHGVLQLYGELDTANNSVRFGTSDRERRKLLVVVGQALAVVAIVEICRRKLIEMLPEIYVLLRQFNDEQKPVR
jgi:hypothetical protein